MHTTERFGPPRTGPLLALIALSTLACSPSPRDVSTSEGGADATPTDLGSDRHTEADAEPLDGGGGDWDTPRASDGGVPTLHLGGYCTGAPTVRADADLIWSGRYLFAELLSTISCWSAGISHAKRGFGSWAHLEIPARARVVATLVPNYPSASEPSSLFLFDGCGESTCLTGATLARPATLERRSVSWVNLDDAPRSVWLAVLPPVGDFRIQVRYLPPVANGTCATARDLAPGTIVRGERFLDGSDPATFCASATPSAASLYYRVLVPAGQRLSVFATCLLHDCTTRILDGCAGARCLGTHGVGSSAPPHHVTWTNATGAARSVLVAVSRSPSAGDREGTFDLRAEVEPAPTNHRCSAPRDLASDVPVADTTEEALDPATTCDGASQPSRFYRITVPAGQRVVALVRGAYTLDVSGYRQTPFVRVLSGCAATACLASAPGDSADTSWTNTGATAQTVLLAVGERSPGRTHRYTLTATVEAPGTHGRCASPLPITPPTVRPRERNVDALEAAPDRCASGERSLYYDVTVPAAARVVVTVSPAQVTSPPVVRFLTGCAADACVPRALLSRRSSAQWTNGGAAPAHVLVAVTAPYGHTSYAPFDVSFTSEPVARDAVCTSAPLLTDPTPRPVSIQGAGEFAPACDSNGLLVPSLFYAVDVPPGQQATATYVGTASPLPGLRFLDGCGTFTCLSPWRPYASTRYTVTTSWRNTGATVRRVLAAVGFDPDTAELSPGAVHVELTP
jgi:hypothetical protein